MVQYGSTFSPTLQSEKYSTKPDMQSLRLIYLRNSWHLQEMADGIIEKLKQDDLTKLIFLLGFQQKIDWW